MQRTERLGRIHQIFQMTGEYTRRFHGIEHPHPLRTARIGRVHLIAAADAVQRHRVDRRDQARSEHRYLMHGIGPFLCQPVGSL